MSKAAILLTVAQATDLDARFQIELAFREAIRRLPDEPGYEGAQLLTEDDDCLIMFLTLWTNPVQATVFRCCPLYQLILSAIAPRMVGTPVIRIFKQLMDGAE